jgi:hypothetical protein
MKQFFILFILIKCVFITAQSFPTDKQKFIKHLNDLYADNESDKVKNFPNDLLKDNLLKNGKIDDATFTQIVNTCNSMQENLLKSYPDIFNYLYSYNHLISKETSSDKLENWHDVIDQLISTKNKSTDDFLKFSIQFFLYGKISDAGNSKWFYTNGDFLFEYGTTISVELENGNLRCLMTEKSSGSNALDSIVIHKTNGQLDIQTKKWIGSGGTINWSKTGVDEKKMFASLKENYQINTKGSEVKLDSVQLTAPYFQNPVFGTIEDRTSTYLRDVDRIYPRFYSYTKEEKVSNIMDGIDYLGGFLIEGEKLIGKGDNEHPAQVIIKKNKIPFITATADVFQFTINSIQSNQTAIKILIGKDSISHNSINFNYNNSTKEIEIARPSKGRGFAPFEDSYHQLDIHAQRILYAIGTNEIRFTYDYGAPIDLRNAKFESKDFFDEKLFESFKGMDAVNPLTLAAKYALEKNTKVFTEGEFASGINKFITQCKPLILEMAVHGFIQYNVEKKSVEVNDKLFKYVDYKSGNRDFDNLSFTSDLSPQLKNFSQQELEAIKSDSNLLSDYSQMLSNDNRRKKLPFYAILDLNTSHLIIDGVDYLTLAVNQPTYVSPTDLQLTIKANRNFSFDGIIHSGKMAITSEIGEFNYLTNSFQIKNAKKVSLTVRPFTEKEKNGEPIQMISELTNVTGILNVDDVKNRSGKNTLFSDYPKLTLSKPCSIFYNNLLKGAYDSTRFYVTIDPFELDSLDNFNEKSLVLKGELTSAGIFPKIKEDIRIMDDYSFGFSTQAPENGFKFYEGNTNYKNKIILSGNGLQGAGTIQFMEATAESNKLTFLPDSTIGIAKFINNPSEEKLQLPDVYNDRSYICYLPKLKLLKASSTNDNPMRLFNNEAHLAGTLVFSEKGMTGNGEMGFKSASMYSKFYQFNRWEVLADTSSFFLKNTFREQGEDPLALKADGVTAKISFKTRKGEFNASKTEQIEFPANLYYCQMDKFFWYMDELSIDLERNNDGHTSFEADASGIVPNFYCYDSKVKNESKISFKALNARYDLKSQHIYCEKVVNLPIGDVLIHPDSNRLVIEKKAVIRPFVNAQIQTLNKMHLFEQCAVEVTDKSIYKAKGKYKYTDVDKEVSFIQMDQILCNDFKTKATGIIKENRGFKLSKQFEYFGNIEVLTNEDSIYCDGSTRIVHDCKYKKSWMAFKDKIQPLNIQIPVGKEIKNTDDQPLGLGIYWDKENKNLYTTFLSLTNMPEDELVYSATGYLQYNAVKNEFQVSTKQQLKQRNENISIDALTTDNYLSLDLENNNCNLYGEGEIKLGIPVGETSIESFGTVRYDATGTKKISLAITSKLSFPVSQELMVDLAKKMKVSEELTATKESDLNKTSFDRAMKHWNNQKDYEKIREAVLNETSPKFPKTMEQTIILSGLELVSYVKNDRRGLKSNSSNVILIGMYDRPVFKSVPCEFYLDLAVEELNKYNFGLNFIVGNSEYFFDLKTNKTSRDLKILTTDELFNKTLFEIKPKMKKIKNFSYDGAENPEIKELFNEIF